MINIITDLIVDAVTTAAFPHRQLPARFAQKFAIQSVDFQYQRKNKKIVYKIQAKSCAGAMVMPEQPAHAAGLFAKGVRSNYERDVVLMLLDECAYCMIRYGAVQD